MWTWNSYRTQANTGYWLGICNGWFHFYGLSRAAKNAKQANITKWKIPTNSGTRTHNIHIQRPTRYQIHYGSDWWERCKSTYVCPMYTYARHVARSGKVLVFVLQLKQSYRTTSASFCNDECRCFLTVDTMQYYYTIKHTTFDLQCVELIFIYTKGIKEGCTNFTFKRFPSMVRGVTGSA